MKEFESVLKVLRKEGRKLPRHLSVKQLKYIAREAARKQVLETKNG